MMHAESLGGGGFFLVPLFGTNQSPLLSLALLSHYLTTKVESVVL